MIGSTVALVGIGDLGGWILELLARTRVIRKIAVCDMDPKWGKAKAFSAMAGAYYSGIYPEVSFEEMDLNDLDRTASVLSKINPDIIVNCTTLMSWWVRQGLPAADYKRLEKAGSGPWIPLHLTLTRKLMLAVRDSGIRSNVVNTCFPDGINAALGKAGLAPTIGGGNSDLIVPGLCKYIGDKLGVPPHNVKIFMIAHHFHVMSLILNQTMGGAPYFIRVLIGDTDVTKEINLDEAFGEAVRNIPPGSKAHPFVASSFVKNIVAIASDTGEITHSPGPSGLTGGWPVRLSRDGAQVVLPQGLDFPRALKIAEEAQRFDGIETIKADGSIVLTDAACSVMKDMFKYDCKQFSLEESESRAKELLERFKSYKERL